MPQIRLTVLPLTGAQGFRKQIKHCLNLDLDPAAPGRCKKAFVRLAQHADCPPPSSISAFQLARGHNSRESCGTEAWCRLAMPAATVLRRLQ